MTQLVGVAVIMTSVAGALALACLAYGFLGYEFLDGYRPADCVVDQLYPEEFRLSDETCCVAGGNCTACTIEEFRRRALVRVYLDGEIISAGGSSANATLLWELSSGWGSEQDADDFADTYAPGDAFDCQVETVEGLNVTTAVGIEHLLTDSEYQREGETGEILVYAGYGLAGLTFVGVILIIIGAALTYQGY